MAPKSLCESERQKGKERGIMCGRLPGPGLDEVQSLWPSFLWLDQMVTPDLQGGWEVQLPVGQLASLCHTVYLTVIQSVGFWSTLFPMFWVRAKCPFWIPYGRTRCRKICHFQLVPLVAASQIFLFLQCKGLQTDWILDLWGLFHLAVKDGQPCQVVKIDG